MFSVASVNRTLLSPINSISRTAKLTGCSEAQVKRVSARHQKESGKHEMLSQKLSSATVQKSVAKPSGVFAIREGRERWFSS